MATLGQIEYHAARHPTLPIGVEGTMSGEITPMPLALALKSGNFGQQDFVERALAVIEGRAGQGGET
jgi:uncharacterized protein YgbK (DUF1537 family)